MLNSRDISLLRADVAANCRLMVELAKADGFAVLVTGTVRDAAYQEYVYKQGNSTTPIPSFHSEKAGLAFDICKNVKGQEYNDPRFWEYVGWLGKRIGFTWGGDWKSFTDKPHFQWDAHGKYTGMMVRSGNYPPAMPLYETKKEEKIMEPRYATIEECPTWAQPTLQKLVDKKMLQGDGAGFNLSMDMIRILVINDRAGIYDLGGAKE